MKKIAKLLLASSMLAALVLACNNGSGLVAHDELDAPDVEAYATASGVIVLEWDAVKDATGYSIVVKRPGQEYFTDTVGYISASGKFGVNRFVWEYDQADAEYEFRIVATTGASLMLSSATEVSVTTPDEEDIADGLAEIALNVSLEKVKGEANKYKVTYPVDLGYDYKGYLVRKYENPGIDAETLFAKVESEVATPSAVDNTYADDFSSRGANAFTTIENDDGDDILVNTDDVTCTAVGNWVVVLRALPRNSDLGAKTLYALSSDVTAVADDFEELFDKVSLAENNGTVSITVALNYTGMDGSHEVSAPAATAFTVWQKETEIVATTSGGNTSYVYKYNWASKAPTQQALTSKTRAVYIATLAEKKSSSLPGADVTVYTDYDYDYYVTYTNKKGDRVWVATEEPRD